MGVVLFRKLYRVPTFTGKSGKCGGNFRFVAMVGKI